MSAETKRASRFARLTSLDLMFLHLESPDWPGHFGGLAVVEAKALLDDSGKLRLQELRERLNRRLARVPQLRRRLHFPGPFGGKAIWVDDHQFEIGHHVHETTIEAPGGDLQLLDAAARLYDEVLNRGRPLWELWFLTGVSDDRVGILLKLHHSVADGMASVAIMASLFDFEPDAPDPVPESWLPTPIPGWWALVADNVSNKIRTVWHAASLLGNPLRLVKGARVRLRVAREALGQISAPSTSLNQVVRSGRRIRFLRLDLGAMRAAAHAHEAKVNDVVLDLWSGGLRALMFRRGEPTSGIKLITNMPVSLRAAGEAGNIGNRLGIMALPLPVCEPDVKSRTRSNRQHYAQGQVRTTIGRDGELPGRRIHFAFRKVVLGSPAHGQCESHQRDGPAHAGLRVGGAHP